MVNPTVNNRKNIVRHSDFSRGKKCYLEQRTSKIKVH